MAEGAWGKQSYRQEHDAFAVTRCQQVNADRCSCVWRGNAKEALPHPLSPAPGFAALPVQPVELQKLNIYK